MGCNGSERLPDALVQWDCGELAFMRHTHGTNGCRLRQYVAVDALLSDEAVKRAYDAFRGEYLRIFPSGGDEQDHDEATESAVVVAISAALPGSRKGEDDG